MGSGILGEYIKSAGVHAYAQACGGNARGVQESGGMERTNRPETTPKAYRFATDYFAAVKARGVRTSGHAKRAGDEGCDLRMLQVLSCAGHYLEACLRYLVGRQPVTTLRAACSCQGA